MEKIALFFLFLFVAATGFTENFVLMNQTSYPHQNAKIAIQWASSAKEVTDSNHALISGEKLKPNTLQVLTKSGKVNVNIPKNAEYFRVLVWSEEQSDPDYHTNWVDVIPNKTYTLKTDHLVPTVLMSGMGC